MTFILARVSHKSAKLPVLNDDVFLKSNNKILFYPKLLHL